MKRKKFAQTPRRRSISARGFTGDGKQLVDLMMQAIRHKGFALIDIFSPCVTFNHDNTYEFFRPRVKRLEDEGHDPHDWKAACEKGMVWGDTIYTGLFLQREAPTLDGQEPVLQAGGPLAHRALGLSREDAQRILRRMM